MVWYLIPCQKNSILSTKKIPSSHKDLVPIPVRGWNFLCSHTHSLTYLSTIRKNYSTSSTSSYVCTCQHVGNTQKRHDIVRGQKWRKMADNAECRADIFRNFAVMSSNTSMLHQNCQRQHPTNPTKPVHTAYNVNHL
jgi:hypothetical protein